MSLTHEYRSAAKSKSCGKRKKKSKNPPSLLAQATFEAFEPFINVLDPGVCLEEPFHTITKETWELNKRHKAGEKLLLHRNGKEFSPYHDIVRNIYSPKHVQKHLVNKEVSYYTSGKNRLGLLYIDLDVHHAWQIDEARARDLLQKLFLPAYWRASKRGYNGYLKVRYSRISQFNDAADQLEATLKRLFLHAGILCDIEVKGTITTKDKSGSLAKLPFSTKPKHIIRDETDCWNFQQLEKFKSCPVVAVSWIDRLVEQIEPIIDEARVSAFREQKDKLDKDNEEERDGGLILVDARERPSPKPSKQQSSCSKPVATPITKSQLSGDAFERNRRDLLPFVRQFYKKNESFPAVEEALAYLQENGLFSGCWHDGERKRAVRVGQILDFIAGTFDPSLLKSEQGKQVALTVGSFAWWVWNQFGSGLTADVVDLNRFDPETLTAPVQQVFVPAKFIEKLLVVVDFCLRQDPLENKAVPTNRVKKIWTMVKGGAAWNQRHFQVVRDRLAKMGVLDIFDRQHQKGKAWRWKVGSSFPEKCWKDQERKLKKVAKRLRTGISYSEFVVNTNIVKEGEVHNSLYQTDAHFQDLSYAIQDIRPPPD